MLPFLAVWLVPAQFTFTGAASYAPLHTFMEMFAIVIAMLIFGVAWNAYSRERPGNLMILAGGFLAVGLIDFADILAWAGMPSFVTPGGHGEATNFQLAARLLTAGTLLAIALRQWQPVASLAARYRLLATSIAVTGLVYWVGLYYADLLPRTFAGAMGLTALQAAVSSFIVAAFVAGGWFLLQYARRRGSFSTLFLFAACLLFVLSELCFTLASDAGDRFDMLGHVYKIAAYALVYRAVFVHAVRSPFRRLSRARAELERANEEIRRVNAGLEQRVAERTATLDLANVALHAEIAERTRAEEEIRTLNADLERRVAERTLQLDEANRAKSDFLANMSHELRTPLNSIIGCAEMLNDGVLGELEAKQRGFVGDIFGAGTHLLSLINDLLDLSKVEAWMLQLEADAVDVASLLKASTLVVREKALAHRIRLDTRLDPALGTMLADERKLKQIVYNLLSNAVKFTADGGAVTLEARRCARAEVALDEIMPARLIALPPGEDGEFLAITVEDSGEGIAEEYLPKLFIPFTQVDGSVARRYAGTGLGLSLVRRLAELHGGTVGVASRPGVGSRFSVWLPYREAAPAAQEGRPTPEVKAPSATAAKAPETPAAPLALVIEDDDRMAELIEAQLRAEGFEVMRTATGEEGLVRAAKHRPRLITLDIFLPAMDGWEFMHRLKADPTLADTPVVIISISDDLDRAIALGARRVLQKPFVREELVAALAGLVDTRPGGEAARVLVVDNNVKAVELLAAVLEAEGYRVLRAYGGAEAIEVAHRARPDLAILDLVMPEVSGFEVVHALRQSERTARIPILVLTARDLTAEDHARLKDNVTAILAKASFSPGDLLAELRRALPRRAGD